MKILFLSNAANIHTVRWVNALAKRDYEVHLVYKFDDEPSVNKISEKVILHRLKYSGTKGYYLNALQLKKIANKINPDVINVHYASGYGTLARIAKLKPYVLSVWGSDVYIFPYRSKLTMKLLVKNLKNANIIASTSESMANQVRILMGNLQQNICITPFGVDLSLYNNSSNKRNSEKVVIGNIKSLKEVYGIEYLIYAIEILKNKFEETYKLDIKEKIDVQIYGKGILKDQLESLTKELGLQNVITFKGAIPNSEVPLALKEMDIFCATSNQESFGVSLVEAMAMNLPVVATDVSGFKEVVDDGKTGMIVQSRNPKEIAAALEKLIFDKELRVKYGKNGREKVENFYNWDDNVNTMIDVYRKSINK